MLNVVVLMGRLTADPELRHTASDIAVTSFSLAVDRSYVKAGAERVTDFIDIVAWRQSAEFICKYFRKGQMMAVQGSIQMRSYVDKDGNKRRAFEILADTVSFADSKRGDNVPGTGYQGGYQQSQQSYAPRPQSAEPAPAFSAGGADDFEELPMDDDLPF